MAVGLPAKTTYVDGDVFSASDINDTNGTLNIVGQTNNLYAGKNKIINGDFGVWQRGTSFSNPSPFTYLVDRYRWGYDGTGATRSVTQQAHTPGAAPVAGQERQYFMRVNQSVAGTGGTYNLIQQLIENVMTLAGQTVTLSFYAKSSTSSTLGSLKYIQSFGSGGSSSVENDIATSIAIGTSWQRYTYTFALPSISGKTIGPSSALGINFFFPNNSTFIFDFDGVQLEAGSAATAFQTATGTIQGELAACQRYYWRQTAADAYAKYAIGYVEGTASRTNFVITPPVPMRTVPTSIDYSTLQIIDSAFAGGGTITLTITESNSFPIAILGTGSTGLTAHRPALLRANNSTSAYLGFSAEL
jgi:hypothetical protein